MNWLKKLFKREISGDKLDELLLSLGKDKKFISNLGEHRMKGYTTIPFAYLDIKKKDDGLSLEIEISKKCVHVGPVRIYRGPIHIGGYSNENDTIYLDDPKTILKKTIPYEELNKNPVLKKYVKGKSLEKSLAVLSVASILASAFFISNNITGNAILTNNSNSSGIIGAGLFVLGLVSFILAKNL